MISYRDNIDLLPDSAIKHIEETWSNLQSNYQEIINDNKRIRHALETVSVKRCFYEIFIRWYHTQESEQLNLQTGDTHRTIFDQCEQITRKFEQISSGYNSWSRKLVNLRDFKHQWQQFTHDVRNVR